MSHGRRKLIVCNCPDCEPGYDDLVNECIAEAQLTLPNEDDAVVAARAIVIFWFNCGALDYPSRAMH